MIGAINDYLESLPPEKCDKAMDQLEVAMKNSDRFQESSLRAMTRPAEEKCYCKKCDLVLTIPEVNEAEGCPKCKATTLYEWPLA